MGYRIIVADDERKIIELIRQLGEWEKLNIEIVAECHSGMEALSKIISEKPDFVLSDIKMPGLDGIDLIQKVREKNLDTLFILLSGYRHFEYARSAIQLNVMEYLLKPIDGEQLNRTLEKTCRIVDQMNENKKNDKKLAELAGEHSRNRLAPFWQRLTGVMGDSREECRWVTIETCNQLYGTHFRQGAFQVISMVSALNGMLEQDDTLLREKVEELIHKCFEGSTELLYNAALFGYLLVLNYDCDQEDTIRNAVSAFFYNVRDLSEIYGNFRLNIGCSQVKFDFSELQTAFEEAINAEWGRLIFLGSSIIQNQQMKDLKHIGAEELITDQEMKGIQDSVRFLREEELGSILGEVYRRCSMFQNVHPMEIRKPYFDLLHLLISEMSDENAQYFGKHYYFAYLDARNYQNLIANVHKLLQEYIHSEQKKLKEKLGKPLIEAVKFIKKNYAMPISQEEVADAANVSPGYLSRLFREEMNVGFSEYLTSIRIEESKHLLIVTNRSIREVAAIVGYPDEKYYSKIFKKSVGIKPTEYRRLYG